MDTTATARADVRRLIDRANATGRVTIHYAGVRDLENYVTNFEGRAWAVETDEGVTDVPESLAIIIAQHYAD